MFLNEKFRFSRFFSNLLVKPKYVLSRWGENIYICMPNISFFLPSVKKLHFVNILTKKIFVYFSRYFSLVWFYYF